MAEFVYDGKFTNLEVDKLYTKCLIYNISASLTLTTLDSGTYYFVNASANNVVITLPTATSGNGMKFTFMLSGVSNSYYLRLTSASTIYGIIVSNLLYISTSGTTLTIQAASPQNIIIGAKISIISNGTNYYVIDDNTRVPLVFT